jgi:7-cyano-7-deazaguanine reductase
MPSRPSKRLETFSNPAPERDYRIHMEIPEFTCVCPMTGQPDFATLVLDYVPDRRCVSSNRSSSTSGPFATKARSTKR